MNDLVPAPPFLTTLKDRQRRAWASGDYAVVGTTLQPTGEALAEAVDVRWDERVLDVAAGNGNATLAAARRGARVVSTDYVPALLERAAERLRAERLAATFEVADAEALPFADASFDAVLSTFGVMFAPDHEQAASELLRVCRPSGRIGLCNWTPASFVGRMLATVARHVPPPAGARPAAAWGDEAHLRTLFGQRTALVVERRAFHFRYRSPAHFVAVFRAWYGPVHQAFAALPAGADAALEQDLVALCERHDRGGGAGLVVPSEYLEVVVHR
jgi:ubiquinone/menaquinone biosynthesis C-methylase UbiE